MQILKLWISCCGERTNILEIFRDILETFFRDIKLEKKDYAGDSTQIQPSTVVFSPPPPPPPDVLKLLLEH